MTTNEAAAMLGLVAELFPLSDLQPEELKLFRDAILRFRRSDVEDVLRHHRLTNDWNRPKFAAVLGELRERLRGEMASDYERRRLEQTEAEQRWQHIAAVVRSLPEKNLAELKAKALLLKTPPELREFYAARDPRKSKPLMSAIYELIESEGSSAA